MAVGKLPEACRKIFIMSRFEDKKYREIAGELEISIKTVETQMSRALKSLRDSLKEYLPMVVIILGILLK